MQLKTKFAINDKAYLVDGIAITEGKVLKIMISESDGKRLIEYQLDCLPRVQLESDLYTYLEAKEQALDNLDFQKRLIEAK